MALFARLTQTDLHSARRWWYLGLSVSLGLGFAFLLLSGLGPFGPMPLVRAAAPTSLIVNTTIDELNSDGDCSLREAIQAANLNMAVDGCAAGSGADTILLPAGIFTLALTGANDDANAGGDLDITDPLTLVGAGMTTTIINANHLDRALHVPTNTVTLTVLDLTVRNGNAAGGNGGGLLALGPVVVSNTTFLSNTAGSVFGGGGGAYFGGLATVTGTTFLSNTASNDGGGGAWFNAAAMVTGTTFFSNSSANSGGGAIFYAVATVADSNFTNNTSTAGNGGGADFTTFSAATVMTTTFVGNTANGNGSRGGGAIFGSTATVVSTTFLGNMAGNSVSSFGGGAYFLSTAVVTGTTFTNNTAGRFGGGAYFVGAATVADTAFLSNTALFGGGVYYVGNMLTTGNFVNSLFAANHANSNQGAGLYAVNTGGDDVVTFRHVTFAASATLASGSAVYVQAGTVNITDTIVASYSVGLERVGGVVNEDYNLFAGVTLPYSGTLVSGGNSFTGTAAFADTALYKLSDTSLAIDSGTDVGVTNDFEGDGRPLGAGFDIGWDEVPPAIPISGLNASNDSPKQMLQAIHFTATISAGTGVAYQWNFGDGLAGSGATTNHIYVALGNYTAIVTATNSMGSVSVTTPVTITEAAFKLYLPLVMR